MNMMMSGINAKIDKKGIAVINLSLEISDIEELNKLIRKLKGIEDVIEVKRVTS
jgi:GTP pyrophosphokinase